MHAHFEQSSKFTEAVSDLIHLAHRNIGRRTFAQRLHSLAYCVEQSQRFYIPKAEHILAGRPFVDFKDMIRLPYDSVCLLTETFFRDTGVNTWMLTLAFNGQSKILKDSNLVVDPVLDPERGFYFINLLHFPMAGRETIWIPGSTIAFLKIHPEDSSGIEIDLLPDDDPLSDMVNGIDRNLAEMMHRTEVYDLREDAIAISNLCVMLNLHNVKAVEREAPEKLNKKRQKRGRLPLYSYKVLLVDNEAWDRPLSGEGTGAGFRSHLRRGHIRRLDEQRRVWVRATYVHGKIPGFVEKEYQMKEARS